MKQKFILTAALVSALAFTACVDETESASVTEVRNAKAEQLRALGKAAEIQAQAALVQAQAEQALKAAQAAAAQAQAEKTAAEAAYQDAQTRLLNAQAEAKEIENELQRIKNEIDAANYSELKRIELETKLEELKQKKAQTDKLLAEYEADIAQAAADKAKAEYELAQYKSKIELIAKETEAALAKLEYDILHEQTQMQIELQNMLSSRRSIVQSYVTDYNTAMNTLLADQKALMQKEYQHALACDSLTSLEEAKAVAIAADSAKLKTLQATLAVYEEYLGIDVENYLNGTTTIYDAVADKITEKAAEAEEAISSYSQAYDAWKALYDKKPTDPETAQYLKTIENIAKYDSAVAYNTKWEELSTFYGTAPTESWYTGDEYVKALYAVDQYKYQAENPDQVGGQGQVAAANAVVASEAFKYIFAHKFEVNGEAVTAYHQTGVSTDFFTLPVSGTGHDATTSVDVIKNLSSVTATADFDKFKDFFYNTTEKEYSLKDGVVNEISSQVYTAAEIDYNSELVVNQTAVAKAEEDLALIVSVMGSNAKSTGVTDNMWQKMKTGGTDYAAQLVAYDPSDDEITSTPAPTVLDSIAQINDSIAKYTKLYNDLKAESVKLQKEQVALKAGDSKINTRAIGAKGTADTYKGDSASYADALATLKADATATADAIAAAQAKADSASTSLANKYKYVENATRIVALGDDTTGEIASAKSKKSSADGDLTTLTSIYKSLLTATDESVSTSYAATINTKKAELAKLEKDYELYTSWATLVEDLETSLAAVNEALGLPNKTYVEAAEKTLAKQTEILKADSVAYEKMLAKWAEWEEEIAPLTAAKEEARDAYDKVKAAYDALSYIYNGSHKQVVSTASDKDNYRELDFVKLKDAISNVIKEIAKIEASIDNYAAIDNKEEWIGKLEIEIDALKAAIEKDKVAVAVAKAALEQALAAFGMDLEEDNAKPYEGLETPDDSYGGNASDEDNYNAEDGEQGEDTPDDEFGGNASDEDPFGVGDAEGGVEAQ